MGAAGSTHTRLQSILRKDCGVIRHVGDMCRNKPGESTLSDEEFSAFFEANFADVWRFVRRRCNSSPDADDATAETFAIAWRRRDAIPAESARPWLFGVARNILSNQRRAGRRHAETITRLAAHHLPRALEEPGQETSPPILEALSRLSPDERELVIMQAWDELSIKEMSVILGCTANAVSLRLFKVRQKLARELGRQQESGPAQKETEGSGHVETRSLWTEGGAS